MNTNGDKHITQGEVRAAIFAGIDSNEDGEMSRKELRSLIKAYAKFLNVKLAKGWMKHVMEWFKAVDTNGNKMVSQGELEAWLKASGQNFSGLKGAVESLAK